MKDAQKELCSKLEAPSYTTDDYEVMAEAANEIRYLAGRIDELERAYTAGVKDCEPRRPLVGDDIQDAARWKKVRSQYSCAEIDYIDRNIAATPTSK